MAAVQGGLPPPPPPSASCAGPSGSAPGSDQKRRRAEPERRPAQQTSRSSADARNRPAETSGRPPPSNWLKRETPFVCDIKFTNDLPEVPCDPKMLVAPLDPQQLAKFHLTTLEKDPKRDLVLEPDLGIPLTVFDIGRYSVPAVLPPLAPEDEALLEGDDDVVVEPSPTMRVRQRLRGSKAELSWLMRTTYISADTGGQAAKGMGEKQAKIMRDQGAGQLPPEDLAAHQIQEIEASFEAARQPPVHQKNRSLHAVEVLPVLPDAERWPNNYVHLVFDSDPTAEVAHLRGKSADERRRFAEAAVAKSYRVSAEDQPDYTFLAYMLPAAASQECDSDAGPSEEEQEQEMRWIREYSYVPKPDNKDFVFSFGDDGRVGYVEMNFRLTTLQGKKGATALGSRHFEKPSRVSVKRRAANEDERAEGAKRLHVLNTGFEPDEEGLFDDEDQGAEADVAADAHAGAAEPASQQQEVGAGSGGGDSD